MNTPTEILPEDDNQIDWLKDQIDMMKTWLKEKETPGAHADTAELETLRQHLAWLESRLSAASQS